MRHTTSARYAGSVMLVLALLVFAACSAGGGAQNEAPSGGSAEEAAAGQATALAGVDEADRLAAGWREDAQLYAIASVVTQVDARGRAPGWLYTYVSPSAGTVASISVQDGEARRQQEQKLPEADIEHIADRTLPPPGELANSSDAIKETGEVEDLLEQNPGAQASAGLDSFSSEEPVWIFSTVSDGERVEEKVPAT